MDETNRERENCQVSPIKQINQAKVLIKQTTRNN